jgi:hypothetical protein
MHIGVIPSAAQSRGRPCRLRVAVAAIGFLLPVSGCVHRDDVKLRIHNDAHRPIENTRVYAGADKSWWQTIAAGDSVGVLLRPDGEPPQLEISFEIGHLPYRWTGPQIAVGTGYAIDIHVADNGAVTAQHCLFPCSLP